MITTYTFALNMTYPSGILNSEVITQIFYSYNMVYGNQQEFIKAVIQNLSKRELDTFGFQILSNTKEKKNDSFAVVNKLYNLIKHLDMQNYQFSQVL